MMKAIHRSKAGHYFNENKTDAVNARRIINILDSAELIMDTKVIFNAIKDLKCCIKVNYPFAKDKWASGSGPVLRKKSDLSLYLYWTVPAQNLFS